MSRAWTRRPTGAMVARPDRRSNGVSEPHRAVALACRQLAECSDLIGAAECLKAIGNAIAVPNPAVIDDYSSRRLLKAEDGRTLARVLGWESDLTEQWLRQKLYLVSPIGAVCRLTTQPFAWDAAAIAAAAESSPTPNSAPIRWPLTPARGIFGGITVPIHLPRGRTGSVSWYSRDPAIDPRQVLAEFGDPLRLAGHRFMDLVYAIRAERELQANAPLKLTDRELECLTWAALGRTDPEIGAQLHRSPATARFHIDNAVRKLGARNRTQAVAIAAERGLIHPLDDI
jgi:DNA-binding CsgD family transcriptional regulator